MAELANCSSCGSVFAKGLREICQKCFTKEEKAFEIVYTFLRDRRNREATILEIVDETGVEEKLIIKFIKQKRLRTSQFPKLSYPCEKCGTGIVTGDLCNACSKGIIREFTHQGNLDREEEEKKRKASVYYSYDKFK